MGIIQEGSDLVERIPRSAWRMSLPLIVVGGAVRIGISLGLIREQAFNGRVLDATSVSLAAGFGILALGLLYAAGSLIPRAIRLIQHRIDRSRRRQALLENARFLPPTSALILYHATQFPNGRIPAIAGSHSFERLWDLKLITNDDPSDYSLVAWVPSSGMVRVNPDLQGATSDLRAILTAILRPHYPGDYDDAQHINQMLAKTLQAERV